MIQNFKQYNESLRDEMKPVSDDDIRKKMGDEKFHIYKSLRDAKYSIKEPYEVSEVDFEIDNEGVGFFMIELWFLHFEISYDGKKWRYKVHYNQESVDISYKNWIEIHHQIISDTNKFFGKEMETIQININRDQGKINSLKKELEKVNSIL